MSERFEKLPREKQLRILNASFKQFAENGFEKASTNEIVKEAGIGKGMLFYYFGSKKELYDYLMNYALDTFMEQFLNTIDDTIYDLLDRITHISRLKMKFYMKYPELSKFITSELLRGDMKLSDELNEKLNRVIQIGNSKMYDHLTVYEDQLREGIDGKKVYRIIEWVIQGYQNDLLQMIKGKNIEEVDFNQYWEEFEEYLKILKTSFYKE
ncbi:TetR/AcrR family transcriptional regulator [Fervidibacillus halotolerans]|uniref:TetR/AcrR family transcriptional regulator n=1 Tax=Fervidibacillus halotolerans TaxID=2980027 RepID=A0A9E8M0X4_9BACI|nr:TetR/AcrR family transcriptional regulator [Fervidibacillus halotolerans]WAA13347.1 TetR/AcrR family transcriptional regulator [Fervidibacillus halotolerans]